MGLEIEGLGFRALGVEVVGLDLESGKISALGSKETGIDIVTDGAVQLFRDDPSPPLVLSRQVYGIASIATNTIITSISY